MNGAAALLGPDPHQRGDGCTGAQSPRKRSVATQGGSARICVTSESRAALATGAAHRREERVAKNKQVYVENVVGGYRMWCAVCGEEEMIPIQPPGMPVKPFTAWMEDFAERHATCRSKADSASLDSPPE
jgi:hypothetical protein